MVMSDAAELSTNYMFILFHRLRMLLLRMTWVWLIIVLAVVFSACWASMAYFEGPAPIATKEVFWWYFIVTSATVGYGDFSPATLGGRITGAVIMLVGIGLLATVLTKVAEAVFVYGRKRLKGELQLHMKEHIVILGYEPGRTEAIVTEILADTPDESEKVVLCANSISENPMPGKIEFVHGNPSNDDTLARACIGTAKAIIIYGATDNDTLTYGIAVNHHAAKGTHIAAYFREMENVQLLRKINPHIECVTSLAVAMLVHAVQDPGTTAVISDLVSHDQKGTSFRLNVPADFTTASFLDLMYRFKQRYDATLIGVGANHDHDVQVELNPESDFTVTGGMSLFYIADVRLNGDIRWQELAS
jgi:voltage-gated potassium channel